MSRFVFFISLLFLTSCVNQEKNIKKSRYHHQIAVELINKQCDKPRALNHLLKAIEFNPKDFLVRHTLATVYYSMNQYKKASIELKKILKQRPDFTEAYVNIARIYIDLNQMDQSLKMLKKAEKDLTYPNKLKILFSKGLAYYEKGQYVKAKTFLMEVFSTPPGKNCLTHLLLGKTEMALDLLEDSEKLLKKSLQICKKEQPLCDQDLYKERFAYEGHLALGQLYIKKGDKNRARYHLNLFLQNVQKGVKHKKAKKLLKEIS